MKTQAFLNVLNENKEKALLFEYQENQFVDTNYHITEVKNTTIHSVDCGGRADEWNETIIQLWESPSEKGQREYMKAHKALEILERVDKIHPLDRNAFVQFEYSNENFHKANLEIHNLELTLDKIIVKLFVPSTDCKAKDACGVPESALVSQEQDQCTPGGGCC